MADKCYLPRRRPAAKQKGDTLAVIRVHGEHYDALCELAGATGLSITGVARKLLDFAIAHVELVDEEGDADGEENG